MYAVLLAGFLLVGPVFAEEAAADDMAVERGEALSRQVCALCHLVNGSRAGASDAVPTFHAIANQPDMTEARIRGFIYAPHPQMPTLQLPENEIDDIVTYIESLRD